MTDFEVQRSQDKLAELGRRFRETLPVRVSRITELGQDVIAGERGGLPELRNCVHALAGAAGTFGYHLLGMRASHLESELARSPEPDMGGDAAWRQALAQSLRELQQAAAAAGAKASATDTADVPKTAGPEAQAPAHPGEQRIYLLEDDPDQAEYLAAELEIAGVSTSIFADAEALRIAVIERRPNAIVADIELPNARDGGLEVVASLKRTLGAPLPVVFASVRSDAETRLRALRAGGDGFFAKPVDVRALRVWLAELTAGHRDDKPLQIVIVEDDEDQAAVAAAALESYGMQVRVLDGALASMDELLATSPDVIVMDMHLPDASGLDLARIIRQEERFLSTPIVFLTADRSVQTRQAVFSNGAFDLIGKPMDPAELVSMVRSRGLEYRSQGEKLSFLGRLDPVTGLANARYLETMLEAGQKGDGRCGIIVSMIELEGLQRQYPSIDALHLYLAKTAGRLRKALPASWLLAYLGEGCFAATGAAESRATLERYAQSLQAAINASQEGGTERIHALISGTGAVLLEPKARGNRGLAEADELAHRAVQSGGGYRLPPPPASVETRALWAKQMRRILKEHDLILLYQPLASAQGENCSYFELSVRRRSVHKARLTFPAPSERDAQTLAVRAELDLIVLSNACRILAQRAVGSTFFVPVAVSTVAKRGFAGRLKALLAKQGTQAPSLCLELDEPELPHSPEIGPAIDELRALRVRLALTGLGETASSERFFERMRPDIVKVGPGLVRDLCGVEDAAKERAQALLQRVRERGTPIVGAYVDDITTLRALWKEGVSYLLGDFVGEADTSLAEGFHIQLG